MDLEDACSYVADNLRFFQGILRFFQGIRGWKGLFSLLMAMKLIISASLFV
jgi:hypothetical protein